MPERLALFATAPRGTEDLLAEELAELGATRVRQDRGGVRFAANLREALRICLWSRIAMRVLYPLAESDASGAQGLYDAALAVPWEEHLTPSTSFAVEATIRDSEHTHSGFVGLKIKDAIADRMRTKRGARPDVDTQRPAFSVVAHLAGKRLSLSLDLCGEPLHKRGYRMARSEAPLKETLAAAILRAARYTGEEPLFDPMCGSGTLLIEAGWIAARRAPSLGRPFAVERWPQMKAQAAEALADLRAEAKGQVRSVPLPIAGMDYDEEVLEMATRNVRAARLQDGVTVRAGDATGALPLPAPAGLLISNPPYGARLGGGSQKGMKEFYFRLGESFSKAKGWRLALLSGNPAFESAFHRRPNGRRALWNGPIACHLFTYGAA